MKENPQIWKDLLENAPLPFFQGDKMGNFIRCNTATANLTGYSMKELLKMNMKDLFSEEEMAKKPLDYKSVDRGDIIYNERVLKQKQGNFVTIEMVSKKTPDGTYLAFMRDISGRKKLETAQANSKILFKELRENFKLLLDLPKIDSIYSYMADFLQHALDNTIIVGVSIDVEGKYATIKSIGGLNPDVLKALDGFDFEGLIQQKRRISSLDKRFIKEGKIIKYHKELKDFIGKHLPDEMVQKLDESFAVKNIYTYGLIKNNMLYGAFHFLCLHETNLDVEQYIIAHLDQASLVIQKKSIEQELQENEEKYRSIVEHSHEGIGIIDQSGKFQYVNRNMCIISGYPENEIIGHSFIKFLAPDSQAKVIERFKRRIKGDVFENLYSINIIRNNGEVAEAELSAARVIDADGQPVSIIHIKDISESQAVLRKLQQAKLEAELNEKKFRDVFTKSADPILILKNRHFVDMNEATRVILLAKDSNMILGKHPSEISPPLQPDGQDSRVKSENMMDKAAENGSWRFDWVHTMANSQLLDVEIVLTVVNSDPDNEIIHAVWRDIRERKRSEKIQKVLYNISNAVNTTRSLKQLIVCVKDELSALVDTSNFFVAIYDSNKDVLRLPYYSDKYDSANEIPAEGTITKYVISRKQSLLASLDKLIELENNGLIKRSGTNSLTWLGIPIKIGEEVKGAFVIQSYEKANAFTKKDLSLLEFVSDQIGLAIHRKITEEDLKLAKEKAEESDRLKSAFLANMSHEIRTPMNGIIGFANLLKTVDLSHENRKKYIDVIIKSGGRMLHIINDLMDISKIESGQMEVHESDVDLNKMMQYLYAFFALDAKNNSIKLKPFPPLSLQPELVYTDKDKLYANMVNLIKNAIKYSPGGEIKFGYRMNYKPKKESPEGELQPQMLFFVEDNGQGIPKDRQEAIFERFIQADIEDQAAKEGTGLGLAITKAFVEMVGGSIWLESEEDKGSSFYFTLPMKNSNTRSKQELVASTEAPNSKSQTRKLSLLIAEDEVYSDMYLSEILKDFGFKIYHAKNGKEAVEMVQMHSDISIVLMDIKMPEMNGYAACRAIREFNQEIILIAQTAYALMGDREKALNSGFNDYLSKPILKEVFVELLQKYI